MNNSQLTARVGLFFLIGVALIWVAFEALHDGKFKPKEGGYVVTAAFSTLKELKKGDDVRMAGVKIGAVEATRLANGRAEAVLRISSEMKIPRDTTAIISMAGLLGTNYISLNLGTPGAGTYNDGDQLQTKDAADLNTIMSDLGSLGQDLKGALSGISSAMSGGSDGQGGLLQKLDKLVNENGPKVSATMSNVQDITTKIRNGEGTIGKLINDPTAYDQLTATLGEIRNAAAEAKLFVANGQELLAQVKSGKGIVGTLLYDDAAAENVKVTTKNIRDLTEKLNNPNSSFGQLITCDALVKDAQATLRKVDRAVDGMGDQGPITAVGIVANALF